MDKRMSFQVPKEFKDEEKWLKFFPTKTFVAMIIGAAILGVFIKIMGFLGLGAFAWWFGGFLYIVTVVLSLVPKRGSKALDANGITWLSYLIRRYIHKKNRRIYIKGIEPVDYEEDEWKDGDFDE